MTKRRGAGLVATIVTMHDLPEAKARAVVRLVFDVVVAELQAGAAEMGPAEQPVAIAARTMAEHLGRVRDQTAARPGSRTGM